MFKRTCLQVAVWMVLAPILPAAENELPLEAKKALRKAVEFFRTKVAVQGGYVWRYSEDLAKREGEGKAAALQVWVQPPGTPSVGHAFFTAYQATGEPYYLETARETGLCLARGQLRSGGWDYSIAFDPQRRKAYSYRLDPASESRKPPLNTSTLDDNNTQAALRFLMELDRALDFKDAPIHEAAVAGLAALTAAQYPNGAWPQRFSAPPNAAAYPVKRAEYPAAWPRIWPKEDYKSYYTFNDHAIDDVIDTLFLAAEIYGRDEYRAAAEKGGDFIVLAQMPEPQPAWAQQYNAQMQPAWARKFEPPSVTGGESQQAMRTLMRVYRATGNKKYLAPIPTALAYLKRSLLADGRLARFYELKTNRPLYFTKDYQLTYDDGDMPTHYSFKTPADLEGIERSYRRLLDAPLADLNAARKKKPSPKSLAGAAKQAIAALDAQGRWVEDGRLRYHGDTDSTSRVIDCQTFIRHVKAISDYLAATR